MTALELRVACAEININYSRLAKRMKCSPSTVANWAKGRQSIPSMSETLLLKVLAEFRQEKEAQEREAERGVQRVGTAKGKQP